MQGCKCVPLRLFSRNYYHSGDCCSQLVPLTVSQIVLTVSSGPVLRVRCCPDDCPMPDPITAARPAPRGAPRPRWGVPTGGAVPFWEAKALRARKDLREEKRATIRSLVRGDNRHQRWTGAPRVLHPDEASSATTFANFTGMSLTEIN